jgi:hypothetical protein
MLNKETVDRLREIDRIAKREMARVDTDGLGAEEIDISVIYQAIDEYENASKQLLQNSDFRDALSTYTDAQDSARGAVSGLKRLDYSVESIEPILTSPIVTESIALLEHDAVPDTDDPEVNEAVDKIINKSQSTEHKREIILGSCAVIADYLAAKAMEQHDTTDLSQNQQGAIVFIIMLIIAYVVTQGLVSIPIAAGSTLGFQTLHDAAQDQADELDLE